MIDFKDWTLKKLWLFWFGVILVPIDIILLIARPAAGKSEIIDYLKKTPETKREERFHVGAFDEIDDFPMLWAWFEEEFDLSGPILLANLAVSNPAGKIPPETKLKREYG